MDRALRASFADAVREEDAGAFTDAYGKLTQGLHDGASQVDQGVVTPMLSSELFVLAAETALSFDRFDTAQVRIVLVMSLVGALVDWCQSGAHL